FTVMNSRGVKLRNSDILKASNLSLITNTKKRIDYAEKWEDIENYFGEDFDNFLSHLRTILVKQKATVNLLKEFEDNIYNPKIYDRNTKEYHKGAPLLNKGEDTFNFIFKYKKYYEYLFEEDHKTENGDYELYNRLLVMRKGFEADYWIAPLLRYYDKFKDSGLIDFIKALDNKFAHDWITGFYPTHRIERVNAIIQAIDDANITDDVLNDKSLVLDEIDDLKHNLSSNIYGKRSAKYVMLKLDMLLHGHTSKMEMPDTISIEHILPQNPKSESQWCLDFTEEERSEWCNKLGNLTLISRRKNSSQSNKDYELKKEKYFKGNIETFSNSVRIFHNHPQWRLFDIEQNQKYVIKVLFDSFGVLEKE
ncbi:HNH endonuclease family protein, partial [Parabacteroides sp. OttesenSCG-928-N08]|nr:HNH endonuclease family protein [Parabacteroides sp. OttesenSCG-928-N08]